MEPVADCDLWGFTLPHELTYTNVLEMLDLAGVPLHAAERGEGRPDRARRRARPSPTRGRWRRSSTPSSSARSSTGWREIVAALAAPSRGARLRALAAVPGIWVPGVSEAPGRAPGLHGVLEHAAGPAAGRARARGRARSRRRRGHARLHRRLPLLPGRHVVPAGARAAGRPRRRGRRPAARRDRLRRGLAALAELVRLLGRRRGARRASAPCGRECASRCPRCASTPRPSSLARASRPTSAAPSRWRRRPAPRSCATPSTRASTTRSSRRPSRPPSPAASPASSCTS